MADQRSGQTVDELGFFMWGSLPEKNGLTTLVPCWSN
jgi:hypothetical protein